MGFLILLGLGLFLAREVPDFTDELRAEWEDPTKRPAWLENRTWLEGILNRIQNQVSPELEDTSIAAPPETEEDEPPIEAAH